MSVTQGLTLKALLENPDLLPAPRTLDGAKISKHEPTSPPTFVGQSAFLGPDLWDKTLPYDVASGEFKDFKLEYMDLDEFFQENDIFDDLFTNQNANRQKSVAAASAAAHQNVPQNVPVSQGMNVSMMRQELQTQRKNQVTTGPALRAEAEMRVGTLSPNSSFSSTDSMDSFTKSQTDTVATIPSSPTVDFEVTPTDITLVSVPGGEEFDPRRNRFSDEELRPQPMIKKSKKIYVPEDLKDDKYWQRRSKNNVAAKRSRDARRIKENQIALRAAYLEKENSTLKDKLKEALEEVEKLKKKMAKYEPDS